VIAMAMMTEEEAQQKWCPQSRSQLHGGANRKDGALWKLASIGCIGACIASQCMSWRWAVAPNVRDDWNKNFPNNQVELRGFCGLAGRPSE
jgi:hypothetical protein